MEKQLLHGGWRMRRAGEADWSEAVVPGTVYTDLLRNGQMENPFWKDNENDALALMEFDYEYETEFDADKTVLTSEQIILHFDGVDTIADIYVNGEKTGYVYNMHRIWEFDVTGKLKEKGNTLKVVLKSPLKFIADEFKKCRTMGDEDAMDGFVHMRKAHCMFGWDWGAHLPDAGIFRPVQLLGINKSRIDGVHILQDHKDGRVMLSFSVERKLGDYEITVTAPDGEVFTVKDSGETLLIEKPMLWWPNGYGEQHLYNVKVTLFADGREVDVWERRIGLRTMTMDIHKDEWGECFAHQVNGVDVFAMGADYIPEDHLLGRVNPETTRKLLELAKFGNFNAVRVWGGGYYPDDWFFDICDELGLMVWMDFMFACAVYELSPEFEANIRQEFIDNVKRIRHHASLGLWCGNNEMEMFVAGNHHWVTKPSEVRDYFIMYERLIPEIVKTYDPQTFYWPASPSSGGSMDAPNDPNRGDVHYWDVWHGNKPFSEYRKFYFRYASEFGFQSFPAMKTIEQFTDDPKDHNIFSYVMEKHQRNYGANGKIMNYLSQMYLYPTEFKTLLYASQLLQADAIRYAVEHFRRNRGRCMGAIYWQFNDCWPVASWASVDYCLRLKALHYYARRFFAPLMISCEEQGMMSAKADMNREHFEFEKSVRISVANESMQDEDLVVEWALRNAKAEVLKSGKQNVHVPALTSVWLEKEEFPDVDFFSEYVSYGLYKNGELVSDGTVIFSYPKYFKYEDPELTFRVEGDEIVVSAKAYAKSVEILNAEEDLIVSDNYFDLNADEKRIKVLRGNLDGLKVRSVYDIR